MIYAIRPEDILAHWPEIGPYIESALAVDVNPPSIDQVLGKIGRGDACCLVYVPDDQNAIRAVAVFYVNSRREVIGEYMAGDDVDDWIGAMYDAVNDFAKANGCKVIRTWARRGWARIAEKYGYVEQDVRMFTKRLDE